LFTWVSGLKITEVARAHFRDTFHRTSHVLILKKWLGYIFDDFYTISSGHPDGEGHFRKGLPDFSRYIISKRGKYTK
jgi:hypothetical protein